METTRTENTILGSETQQTAAAVVAFLALLDAPARPVLRLVKAEPAPVLPVGPVAVVSIEGAEVPAAPINTAARKLNQKDRSAAIRRLLKAQGIKGVSVTSATGSMWAWTNVRFEGVAHPRVADWCEHNSRECPICQRNQAAERKMHAIILAAFPDLGDRSDSQSDHFDFVYTVNVERVTTGEA